MLGDIIYNVLHRWHLRRLAFINWRINRCKRVAERLTERRSRLWARWETPAEVKVKVVRKRVAAKRKKR